MLLVVSQMPESYKSGNCLILTQENVLVNAGGSRLAENVSGSHCLQNVMCAEEIYSIPVTNRNKKLHTAQIIYNSHINYNGLNVI